MDYIEREAAKMAVVEALGKGHSPFNAIVMLPAADVVPVRHGEWNKLSGVYYACTACHRLTEVEKTMGNIIYNYCPHCGADMRQQEETE